MTTQNRQKSNAKFKKNCLVLVCFRNGFERDLYYKNFLFHEIK